MEKLTTDESSSFHGHISIDMFDGFDDESESTMCLEVIRRVSAELSSVVDIKGVCDVVQNRVAYPLGYSSSAIVLIDDNHERYRYYIGQRFSKFFQDWLVRKGHDLSFSLTSSQTFVARCLREGVAFHSSKIEDYLEDAVSQKMKRSLASLLRISSIAVFPISHSGAVIGALVVALEQPLKRSDFLLLDTLGAYLGDAISLSRLHQDSENVLKNKLIGLQRISTDIAKRSSEDEVLEIVVGGLAKELGVEYPTIFLSDSNAGNLRVGATRVDSSALRLFEKLCGFSVLDVTFPIVRSPKSLIVRSFAEQKVLRSSMITDFWLYPIPIRGSSALEKSLNSKDIIAIPLTFEGKRIGVLTSAFTQTLSDFDLDLLKVFANNAAAVISNIRLYNQYSGQVSELQELLDRHKNFLAYTAHELKTPLAALRGNAELLKSTSVNISDEYENELEYILQSTERMSGMISRLAASVKYDENFYAPSKQSICLEDFIEDELAYFVRIARDKQVTLEFDSDFAGEVEFDPVGLADVFQNLVINAIKYSPAGSSVLVSVQGNVGEARLTVTDAGPGVPAELQMKVFDKYFSGHVGTNLSNGVAESSGLGLNISRMIVEANGGSIFIDPDFCEGCRFVVEF